MIQVGTMPIICEYCGSDLEIPILAGIGDWNDDGNTYIKTEPDVSRLWLHSWSEHGE